MVVIKLEDVCIGHINSRNEDCRSCKMDEHNEDCSDYLNRTQAIEKYRPEVFTIKKCLQ